MQIAIVTGEASGDRVGGQLAAEIRRLRPDAELWGTGGKFLRDAGVELIIDSSRWGIVGAVQAIGLLPTLLRARARLLKELLRRKPDLLIAIDAGALHVGFGPIEGVLPWARRNLPQTRILYYFPPSSWRRTLKGTSLGVLTDAVATPFPWSASELQRLGVENVAFVGHPLLDLVRPEESAVSFAERFGIDRDRPVVGIVPGSRRQEIAEVLPVQLEAASIIHRRVPGVQFVLALAPTVDREEVVRAIERQRRKNAQDGKSLKKPEDKHDDLAGQAVPSPVGGPPVGRMPDDLRKRMLEQLAENNAANGTGEFGLVIVENATYGVMASSDVLMATSGTATLEAAILGRPMVIMYRMSRNNALQYALVKQNLPPHIGLPNIIAGERIVPEFVQDAATPNAIASEVIALLLEPERMLKMREALQKIIGELGEPGGAGRAAAMAVSLAENGRIAETYSQEEEERQDETGGIKEGRS